MLAAICMRKRLLTLNACIVFIFLHRPLIASDLHLPEGTPELDMSNETIAAKRISELTMPIKAPVDAVAFSPDGNLLATRFGSENLLVWDWRHKDIVRSLTLPRGANDSLVTEKVLFSPNGRYLLSCHWKAKDAVITIWNVADWSMTNQIRDDLPGTGCSGMAFSPNGEILYRITERQNNSGNTLIAYETEHWTKLWGLNTSPFDISTVAVSPNGKLIAVAGINDPLPNDFNPFTGSQAKAIAPGSSAILVLDARSREVVDFFSLTQNINYFSRLAWDSTGRSIVSASALGLERCTLGTRTPTVLAPPSPYSMARTSLRFTANGKFLLEGYGNGHPGWAKIWDSDHKILRQTIPYDVRSIATSADSKFFATGEMGKVEIWAFN